MKNEALLAGEKVSVSRNGTVQWVSVHKIRATCATNMTSFPFDDQDCHLKYGSWVHNGWNINLSLVMNNNSLEIVRKSVTQLCQASYMLNVQCGSLSYKSWECKG